jgi:hypothetical protein
LDLLDVVGVDDLLGVARDDAVGEQSDECSDEEEEEDEAADVGAAPVRVLHHDVVFSREQRLSEFVVRLLAEFVHLRIYYIKHPRFYCVGTAIRNPHYHIRNPSIGGGKACFGIVIYSSSFLLYSSITFFRHLLGVLWYFVSNSCKYIQ